MQSKHEYIKQRKHDTFMNLLAWFVGVFHFWGVWLFVRWKFIDFGHKLLELQSEAMQSLYSSGNPSLRSLL